MQDHKYYFIINCPRCRSDRVEYYLEDDMQIHANCTDCKTKWKITKISKEKIRIKEERKEGDWKNWFLLGALLSLALRD